MRAAQGVLCGVLGSIACSAAAHAEGDAPFGGSLALVSDYVSHGISLSCGDPAVQADLHARWVSRAGNWETFAGGWGSATLGGSDCSQRREVDAYLGERVSLTIDTSATLTYVHYAFPGGGPAYLNFAGRRYDYDELQASWAWQDRLFLTLGYTPDTYRFGWGHAYDDRSALSYGVTVHQPIWGRLTLSAGAGYDEMSDPRGTGFGFWNAGLAYSVKRLELTLIYFRTSPRAERLFGDYIAGGRVSAVALVRF